MSVPTASLRNVAIAGHGGTGKTTLVEQILAAGGAIPKAERVETGRTKSRAKSPSTRRSPTFPGKRPRSTSSTRRAPPTLSVR